ncbi:MAG: helix-turn-helix domain-containing protein [Bacteroidales bacterium]|nr:helix-turn-helix domain-containing protein [Bacteroidales bacterium]
MKQTYSLQEFADLFLVKTHTVARWLSIGIIKGEKKLGSWAIPKSEIHSEVLLNIPYLRQLPIY